MKKEMFVITLTEDGSRNVFKSLRAGFKFLSSEKNLCQDSNFGWKQQQELKELKAKGLIEYGLEEVDIDEETSVKLDSSVKAMVKREVEKVLMEKGTRKIEISFNKTKTTLDGPNHYQFEKVLRSLAARTNVLLVGAAGSGKSTLASKAAKALGLKFYSMSVGIQTSKTEFQGYMDANGKYVTTNFRKAWESGGVFLIDEIDAGNPGVMTIINGALANGIYGFPDDMVEKHPDFLCVAAANTWGKGADRMYVGRNQLDAATLDRFTKIYVDYDENMEEMLACSKAWFRTVQSVRKAVYDKKLRVLVSPRVTYDGGALLQQGFNFWEVLEMKVFNGIADDELTTILNTTGMSKDILSKRTLTN